MYNDTHLTASALLVYIVLVVKKRNLRNLVQRTLMCAIECECAIQLIH